LILFLFFCPVRIQGSSAQIQGVHCAHKFGIRLRRAEGRDTLERDEQPVVQQQQQAQAKKKEQ
jgi:hypothetical protein